MVQDGNFGGSKPTAAGAIFFPFDVPSSADEVREIIESELKMPFVR